MKNKRLLTLTVALIALGISGCVRLQINNSITKTPIETIRVQSKSVSIIVDNTGSSSSEDLPQIADDVKDSLLVSEYLTSVDVFNIGGNGKQSWQAARRRFDLPEKPVNKFNEVEAKVQAKKNGCGTRLACINREIENARKQAETNFQSELSSYNEKRKSIVQEIGEAILQSPVKSPSCSDIQEMAELVAQSSSEIVIWLTDGQHNCKTVFTGVEFKNKAVLIGVLPLKNEAAGGFGKRFAELSAKFPDAQVKPTASFNKQMMLNFLAR